MEEPSLLWDGIAADADQLLLTDQQAEELDRRLAAHEKNPERRSLVVRAPRSTTEERVSLRVRFKPAAEHDVESAFRWYEDHRSGVGSEFLAAVDSAVSLIVSILRFVVRGRVRRAVLRRFPYLMFYVIEPEEVIVLACMHASRDPERWPS